jgi:hypothetical protein
MMPNWSNLRIKPGRFSPFAMLAAVLILFAAVQIARLVWTVATPIAPMA